MMPRKSFFLDIRVKSGYFRHVVKTELFRVYRPQLYLIIGHAWISPQPCGATQYMAVQLCDG